MRAIFESLCLFLRAEARRRQAFAVVCVEPLEGRQLLSGMYATAGRHHQAEISARDDHGGQVRKDPMFYEFYIGPKRADLNAVAASVKLDPGKGLVFRGVMQGKIDTTPATSADDSFYVFGVNRGSSKAVAPFFNRPGVVFDAVVVVSVTHDGGITGSVVDLTTGVRTALAASSIKIEGKEVRVTVDPALLPTPAGGKPLSQYTFNLWPRSSLANPAPAPTHPSFVASFLPENAMAPIKVPGHHGHGH
jgi:hypothetical protein